MLKRQRKRELYKTTMSKRIMEDGILQAYTITRGHLNSPTNIEKPWHVMSQDTISW
jgi:hypothetical protein